MKNMSTRRGSALLIVLGMLSFIVVSAVAFATYMRYARLPSSYLRRTSASRLLVKAALAEAIERIDASIGDNPYPGVGEKMSYYPREEGNAKILNYWRDRVFIGTNLEVKPTATASPLNFEALAYVPPPFINELRYWSRRSEAGKWRNLGYDSGRYVFAALDVSDCYDINRMVANAARDSSDLGRITLAHSFEKANHGGYVIDPEKWDTLVKKIAGPGVATPPFVSMADFALVANDSSSGLTGNARTYAAPFAAYVRGERQRFVTDNSTESDEGNLLNNLTLISDSFATPPTQEEIDEELDISKRENQPLEGLTVANGSSDKSDKNEDQLSRVINVSGSEFWGAWQDFGVPLSGLLRAQLYDYLDRDSIPLSLALPVVERTPMITGVQITPAQFNMEVTARKSGETTTADANGNERKTSIYVGTLNMAGRLMARVGLVYPFKYKRGSAEKFKVQLAASIAFVQDAAKAKNLRIRDAVAPVVFPTANDWKTSKQVQRAAFGGARVPNVVTLFSDVKEFNCPATTVKEERDAVLRDQTFDFQFNEKFEGPFDPSPKFGPVDGGNGTFRYIEVTDESGNRLDGEWDLGTQNFRGLNDALSALAPLEDGQTYFPVIQVWARVLDKSGNVVDLVPACLADDITPMAQLGNLCKGSRDRAAFRFAPTAIEGASITISSDLAKVGQQPGAPIFEPSAYIAGDPRYNYAPENWVAHQTFSGELGETWLREAQQLAQENNRDGDIFMATSDAGYLQSMWEFALLANVSGTDSFSTSLDPVNTGYDGSRRGSLAQTPAYSAMWKTLSSPKALALMRDKLKITSGRKGFRVNPLTQDINVMMSAIANTPMDWWAASTNNVNDTEKKEITKKSTLDDKRIVLDLEDNIDYTFSEDSSNAPVKHGKMTNGQPTANSMMEVASSFTNLFVQAGLNNKDWKSAYDDFDWDSLDFGQNPLHSVDRNFLYGYWRECFDNRQHLFLVFVRAEPTMMGGGGLGQTPPQLGGRAVALVWRDPKNPTPASGSSTPGRTPHRTRVLFYRQLD